MFGVVCVQVQLCVLLLLLGEVDIDTHLICSCEVLFDFLGLFLLVDLKWSIGIYRCSVFSKGAFWVMSFFV